MAAEEFWPRKNARPRAAAARILADDALSREPRTWIRCVKLSLERKVTLGFAAALIVLVLVSIAAWWNVARFRSTLYWVDRARQALNWLEQTRSDVLSMQAGVRGFALTGSDEALEPFHRSSTRITQALVELRPLLRDNARQEERLDRLEPLIARLSAFMADRIAARRSRGLDAAAETEAVPVGQRAVEEFIRAVDEMAAAERALLDARLDRANTFGRLTVFTIVGASALACGFVAVAGKIVRRDLRLRRQTEIALKESFDRVEDLYNRAPCGYHSLDERGVFVAINDTELQWLGYTRNDVVRRMNFIDILSPASAAVFPARFRRFKENGSVAGVEYEWRRKDGTIIPVLLNATAIYDEAGNYVASRATAFDITEQKRAELERDRFFTLSRDLLCIAGSDGRFKRINPAWAQSLGYGDDDFMARPFIDFVHPGDVAATKVQLARLIAGREVIGFENRLQCKDGTFRWFRWNARPVVSEKLIYASAHDVTEQRVSAERIQWLNADLATRAAQLEAANHELESFSYSVSHDLRAPLRHIDGFASLLVKRANTSLDAEGRRFVATISKSAKQMGTLIDDLLAFSRIGRVPLCLEPVSHDQILADVIANGRYDSETRRIEWEIGRLPAGRGDAAMLRQVWSNLIENAVKYSGKAPISRITIGASCDSTSGQNVFHVRDNGVGFDMAYADKLFGVFQRLHGATEFEGTGIGLANVRRIVTRHGGRTWAESRLGEGATFYFSLPMDGS
jgi:PAS domain S-box-containing protein